MAFIVSQTLDQLVLGAVATVVSVSGAAAFRRRLLEIGLVPGTRVERVGDAFGDPVRYRVRDAVIALRRTDARHVHVALA